MNYPSINEYIEAIRFAEDNFDQLKHLRPVLGGDGEPVMTSGNFAVVFQMKDEQTGKFYAVKCFRREQKGRAEAYRQIAEELEYVSSTFLTPIKYLDKELFVDTNAGDDKEFPVLLMDWVEGDTLDKYIRNHLNDQYELSLLAYQFSRLAMWLMPQPFAHGDLKPDNILVKSDGTLVLVDYDGMYVPAMKGQKARELGSPDFRHPSRTETDFDEHIDDFSLASILLSLKAISLKPLLLEEYGASDRLLFSDKDYRNLSESKVMDALKSLMQNAELASLYSIFILAASQNNLSGVSFRLFYLNRPSVSSPKKSMRVLQINKKIVNQSNKKIIKKEVLTSFHGKNDVIHFVHNDGTELWTTDKRKFIGEIKSKGGSRIDTIENDKEHVIYLYDDNDKKVGIYFIEEQLHGKAPKTISEIKDNVVVIEVWLDSAKKWIPSVGVEKQTSKELLPFFQGKKNVWHIVASNGSSSYLTQERSFDDEAFVIGACKLNTVENDKKHVLFLFNDKDAEVGRYYLGKKLQGLTPAQLTEMKKDLCVFESWNPETKKWVPCIGKSKETDENKEYIKKYGKTKSEYLKENFNEVNTLTAVCLKKVFDFYHHYDYPELEVGKTYKVTHIGVFRSFTRIMLSGFGNKEYNSVCFEIFENGESINKNYTRDPRFEAPYLREKYHPNLLSNDSIEEEDITTEVTDEDLAKGKEIILWGGGLYSPDNSRLLVAPKNLKNFSVGEGVKVICDGAFNRCFDLENIILPNSIIKIGKVAFSHCFSLKTISIPEGVTSIDDYAFSKCINLESITIPSSVSYVGKLLFRYCNNLKSIMIPIGTMSYFEELVSDYKDKLIESYEEENLSTEVTDKDLANAWIDDYGVKYSADRKRLLRAPRNLKEYSIIAGTKVICDKAFDWCADEDAYVLTYNDTLESITIPDSIIRIGNHVFRNCLVLDGIVMPKSLRYIGDHAFSGCKALSEVNLPESVMEIGDAAFCGCEALTSINIPNSLSKLRDSVFSECAFSRITIPDTIKEIDNYVFYLCKDLKRVSVPTSVNKFGVGIFGGCSSLEHADIPNTIKELGHDFFSGCVSLSEIVLPQSVKFIGDRAFQHCHSITEIVIPEMVSNIGEGAFGGCSSLKSIVIPDGVTTLGNSAFEDCSSLQSVKISKSISIIGNFTFSGCTALQSIYIPNGVTDIEDSFWGCNNLSCISIPNSVTYIGDNIFMECYSLKVIRIPVGRKNKFEKLLSNYKNLLVEQYEEENLSTEITNEDLKKAWTDEYGVMFSADKKRLLKAPVDLMKYSIPEGTKVICNGYALGYDWGRRKTGAFNGCAVLTRVEIPNSVTHIGYKAFYNCSNLTTLVLPDSIVAFGEQVFDGCFQLQKIIIPFGTKEKYHFWLPQFSHIFVEQIKGWTVKSTRSFDTDEIAAVDSAEVVQSKYGLSVRFKMNAGDHAGDYTYIPLCESSSLNVGDTVDMSTAKLIILSREGEKDIARVME